MPLPSLWISKGRAQPWSIARAAGYGAALGALAALFKILGPAHLTTAAGGNTTVNLGANILEIGVATLAFALLCAGASALRNFIAQRLIWPEIQ